MSSPRDPYHTGDCPACGAPIFEGRTAMNETKQLDLKARVFAIVGVAATRGTEIVRTELALVEHKSVCAYRDV